LSLGLKSGAWAATSAAAWCISTSSASELYGRIGGWFSSYAIPTCNWEVNTIGHKLIAPETNSASLLALATSFQTLIGR